MDFVNKRSFIRANVHMPVMLQSADHTAGQTQALAVNISVEGMLLMAEGVSLTVGQIIKIKLSGAWSHILLTARVVRKDKNSFACRFVDLSLSTEKTLDEGIYKLWRQNVRIKLRDKNINADISNLQISKQGLNLFV